MPLGVVLGSLLVLTALLAVTVGINRMLAAERAKSRSPFTLDSAFGAAEPQIEWILNELG